jgi:hypothetical protein
MSGFGIRALKKKVDNTELNTKRSFFKHVVYGESFEAVLTFLKLNKLYPGEVKLITQNPYFYTEIIQQIHCSLNPIRNEEVASTLMGLNPELEIFKSNTDVQFYKDTKFHKFGGRAKSHDLKPAESFYTQAYYSFKPEALIPSELELDKVLQVHQLQKILAEIVITEPTDLVEKVNFKLATGEHEYIDCEKLYFCESPKKFFNLVKDKSTISDTLQEFIAPINEYSGICVYFECDRLVHDSSSTMIIPQSMTHDWGSFMLDFEAYNPVSNTQIIKALSFISEDDVQEEDLAKKIRLMTRVIERVLPDFAKAQVKQTIKYSTEFLMEGVQDEYAAKIKDLPVQFISSASPIELDNASEYKYLTRSLVAINSLTV